MFAHEEGIKILFVEKRVPSRKTVHERLSHLILANILMVIQVQPKMVQVVYQHCQQAVPTELLSEH